MMVQIHSTEQSEMELGNIGDVAGRAMISLGSFT